MKKYLFITFVFVSILFMACEEGSIKFITTDHDGYAEELFVIPETGKIKITEIDANCNEIEKAGKFYKTHYEFDIRGMKVVLNSDCSDFKPTEFTTVEKGDKIKMVIRHGEANTRYKIKYEFIVNP